MPLELSQEQPSEHGPVSDEDSLLAKLQDRAGKAGNKTLMEELAWDKDRYFTVRDRLIDKGKVVRGRGKGGSVRIIAPLQPDVLPQPILESEPSCGRIQEGELYDPIARVLANDWAKDRRFREHHVEITAGQGRRETGGKWTRPDIVVSAIRTFPHVPGKTFDVVTFEVKPSDSIDVTVVFEALAHSRSATQAYAWLHMPNAPEDDSELILRIQEEARRHGIGLSIAADPNNYETWDIRVEASRREPDPEALNEFISVQLSDDAKEKFSIWFR